MIAFRCSVVFCLAIAASCAKQSASAGDDAMPSTSAGSRATRNPNVITAAELHDPVVISMDALKAIRYLRPAFFRTSGPQSFSNGSAGQVQISPDFGPLQPLPQLASFTTISLYEVRYLDINEAANRFGINSNGGAVIVLLTSKQ